MPKQTIQASLIEGLIALGYTQSHTKLSSKYLYFTKPNNPRQAPNSKPIYIIVGRKGSLRRGTSISNSCDTTDNFKHLVREAGPAKRAELQAQQAQAFADL